MGASFTLPAEAVRGGDEAATPLSELWVMEQPIFSMVTSRKNQGLSRPFQLNPDAVPALAPIAILDYAIGGIAFGVNLHSRTDADLGLRIDDHSVGRDIINAPRMAGPSCTSRCTAPFERIRVSMRLSSSIAVQIGEPPRRT